MIRVLVVASLSSLAGFCGSLPESSIATPHGHIVLHHFEIIQIEKDRPCGFSAVLDNVTGVTWDDVSLRVEANAGGKSIPFVSNVGTIEAGSTKSIGGPCPDGQTELQIESIKASMLKGAPRKHELDVARMEREFRSRCVALGKATATKRISDLTVAEVASLRRCGSLP